MYNICILLSVFFGSYIGCKIMHDVSNM